MDWTPANAADSLFARRAAAAPGFVVAIGTESAGPDMFTTTAWNRKIGPS